MGCRQCRVGYLRRAGKCAVRIQCHSVPRCGDDRVLCGIPCRGYDAVWATVKALRAQGDWTSPSVPEVCGDDEMTTSDRESLEPLQDDPNGHIGREGGGQPRSIPRSRRYATAFHGETRRILELHPRLHRQVAFRGIAMQRTGRALHLQPPRKLSARLA